MSATIHPIRPLAPEACPVQVGDVVHVPNAVPLRCGRKIRPANYRVMGVEYCETRRAWRLVIETRADCSALPPRYRPDPETGHVPLCAQPTRFYLDAGEYTHYASGAPEAIDDRHTQL